MVFCKSVDIYSPYLLATLASTSLLPPPRVPSAGCRTLPTQRTSDVARHRDRPGMSCWRGAPAVRTPAGVRPPLPRRSPAAAGRSAHPPRPAQPSGSQTCECPQCPVAASSLPTGRRRTQTAPSGWNVYLSINIVYVYLVTIVFFLPFFFRNFIIIFVAVMSQFVYSRGFVILFFSCLNL